MKTMAGRMLMTSVSGVIALTLSGSTGILSGLRSSWPQSGSPRGAQRLPRRYSTRGIGPVSLKRSLSQGAHCAPWCAREVSSYRADGFNLPVIKSIACGTPVIVTDGRPTDDFRTACFIRSKWVDNSARNISRIGYHLG
jgi:hypothetical protein